MGIIRLNCNYSCKTAQYEMKKNNFLLIQYRNSQQWSYCKKEKKKKTPLISNDEFAITMLSIIKMQYNINCSQR